MSKTEIRALLTFFALTFGWTWGLWAIVTFRGYRVAQGNFPPALPQNRT